MIDLSRRVAIVTGGGRGIGKGISATLARQGAMVVIADILDEGLQTAKEIEAIGRNALTVKVDLTNKSQVDQMVAEVIQTCGKIDILVCNAGWDQIELFSRLDPAVWDKIIAINYKHQLYVTKAVVSHMVEKKYGRIIYIASDAGRVGSTGEAVYAGCKGAVIAFTKTIAREFARFQITANCICPGPTKTPLTAEQSKEDFGSKILSGIEKAIPLGRWGEPQDIANAVAFFASDEASFITGQTLSVSGGLTMV